MKTLLFHFGQVLRVDKSRGHEEPQPVVRVVRARAQGHAELSCDTTQGWEAEVGMGWGGELAVVTGDLHVPELLQEAVSCDCLAKAF
jgi:hypothetical protein